MLRRILSIVLILPISIGIIMLAVANRHPVALVLDPFAGALSVDLPLFVVVLASLIIGVALGGITVWLRQGRYRRAARSAGRDARRANAQVENLRAAMAERAPRGPMAPGGGMGPIAPVALPGRRDAA
ncbi:putative integral membrane protein [Ancylobacter sp. 3268]|uniref:LapA family protein n=1 Tax=Ancylobacter sp. 3268 TaxID=2817752 RepID=UPI0028656ADD|nr:LapA family protein [Ancylobacter sp. 3268]MDR6953587.1 putative integral membrane protein [Ancylobacter sp. 3268]